MGISRIRLSILLRPIIQNYPYDIKHKTRVIGYIDPPIEDTRPHWKLWVLAKWLDRDLVDYSGQIHLLVTSLIFSNILHSWEDVCFLIDGMLPTAFQY